MSDTPITVRGMIAPMPSLGALLADAASHKTLAFAAHTAHVIGPYLLAAAATTLSTYIYGQFFRARHDFVAENSVARAHRRADRKKPAALVSLTLPPTSWVSWLSDEVIELSPRSDPGKYHNHFPGHQLAVAASLPYRANGAEQVTSRLAFDLKGTHHSAALVTRIRAVIDARRPVPNGTVFYAAPQGTTERQGLAFDLGSPDLDARIPDIEYGTPTLRHYLADQSISLKSDESAGFVATIFAPFYDYEIFYHFLVNFTSGPPVTIDDNGTPFRITGYPHAARRAYFSPSNGYQAWPGYPDLVNTP
jgi:hypothetical protein